MNTAAINATLHSINNARKAADVAALLTIEAELATEVGTDAAGMVAKSLRTIAACHRKMIVGWPTERGSQRRIAECRVAIKNAAKALKVNAAAL